MAKENEASGAILGSVVDNARHPKTKAAAKNIQVACDYLEKHKIRISIGEVAALCDSTGPKLQSIHNNKGFKSYVMARRGEQRLGVRPGPRSPRYETDNPEINAVLYALGVEARRAEDRKENAIRAIANDGEYDLEATVRTGRLVRFKAEQRPIDTNLIAVVRKLLDVDHLRKFGLNLIDGRVIASDRNNRVFLEKGDVEQLAAMTKSVILSTSAAASFPPPSGLARQSGQRRLPSGDDEDTDKGD